MFENVDILLALLLSIAPVLLAVLEHFVKKGRAVFLALNTLYFAAACVILVTCESSLACVLIVASVSLCARLFAEILEGRENK